MPPGQARRLHRQPLALLLRCQHAFQQGAVARRGRCGVEPHLDRPEHRHAAGPDSQAVQRLADAAAQAIAHWAAIQPGCGRGQRLVGFSARAALLAEDGHTYTYDWALGTQYNMVLTNAAFVDRMFFRAYWAPVAAPIRQIVEDYGNVRM